MSGYKGAAVCSGDAFGLAVCFCGGAGKHFGAEVQGTESVVPTHAVDRTFVGGGDAGDVVCMGFAIDSFGKAGGGVPGADTAVAAACEERLRCGCGVAGRKGSDVFLMALDDLVWFGGAFREVI